MSDQSRSFPDRPSLRFLKIEARRRLAAGEFARLHEAQLAIAREHGLSSWTVLKQHIASQPGAEDAAGTEGHALEQLRWIIDRFSQASEAGWQPPGDDELREHLTSTFLTRLPGPELAESLSRWADAFRAELTLPTATSARSAWPTTPSR